MNILHLVSGFAPLPRDVFKNSGQEPADHFEDYLAMIDTGITAKHQVDSVRLSRYAYYPAADSIKKIEKTSSKLPAKSKALRPPKDQKQ